MKRVLINLALLLTIPTAVSAVPSTAGSAGQGGQDAGPKLNKATWIQQCRDAGGAVGYGLPSDGGACLGLTCYLILDDTPKNVFECCHSEHPNDPAGCL